MGPSRTNPKTGEILDADIIFDEGMIRYWRQEYIERAGIPDAMALLLAGQRQAFFKLFAADLPAVGRRRSRCWIRMLNETSRRAGRAAHASRRRRPSVPPLGPAASARCQMGPGMQRQLGCWRPSWRPGASWSPAARCRRSSSPRPSSTWSCTRSGHTLGLRHNFKASSVHVAGRRQQPGRHRQKGQLRLR